MLKLTSRIEQPISRRDEIALRIAALLHDVGHCFLSHVSERALERLKKIDGEPLEDVHAAAKEYFGCFKAPALGEILSALLILIPEFRDVLATAQIPFWNSNEADMSHLLARLVVRGRLPDRPFMNDIISGTLDADKLDYMSRDCYMAGLAMPIDTERLLEKLNVVTVPTDSLSDHMESAALSHQQTVQVLAVQHGGAKVFEDFVLSRVLLYDKLYNHHKVRALEGWAVNVIEFTHNGSGTFSGLGEFAALSDSQFIAGDWIKPSLGEDIASRARKMLEDLRLRNVVRAFAFGPTLIEGEIDDQVDGPRIRSAWRALADVTSRTPSDGATAFRRDLARRAKEYFVALGQPGLASELDEYSIVIDLPDVQGIAAKTMFFVGDEHSGIRQFNELFRVDKWAEAYENQKLIGYVFCQAEYSIGVHLAFRDLVKERYQLSFEPWSWSLTKIGIQDRERAAIKIQQQGIKTASSPVPAWLQERDIYLSGRDAKARIIDRYSEVIERLAQRFTSFQPASGIRVDAHRIQDWLTQFGPEELPLAITLIEHIRFWDRPALVNALETYPCDKKRASAQWVPLGGATTSAHQMSYLWPDLKNSGKLPSTLLGSVSDLAPEKEIVFYDDNIGSAGQAVTVLQQLWGIEKNLWMVDEDHVEPLPEEKRRILQTVPVRFFFVTGRRAGLRTLVRNAKSIFSNTDVNGAIIAQQDASCFQAAAGVFQDSATRERAELAFRAAGVKAMADRAEEWGAKKTEERLLGYGNHGGLNVFFYNVPTSTVSAIWKDCKARSPGWMALFPRRGR
jgi:HD superfamily phosphohydrolase